MRGSPATIDYFGRRLVLRGRRSTWSTSGAFCLAGAALGAPQARFAWQVQHWKHLSCVLRGTILELKPSTQHHRDYIIKHNIINTLHHLHYIINTTPPTQHHQTQHHQHNIINTTSSSHHHLHSITYTIPSTQHHLHYIIKHNIINTHHLHYIINTTSSTQPHQHITIYTTPSTQHQLHNTINTTPSTLHHQTLAGAALGALPYYPFCLIPADTPFVILRCGLFFVLFH